MAGGDNFFSW